MPRNTGLRIVCCGSHMGGKTSLTRALAARLGMRAITHSRPTAAARVLGYEKASVVPEKDIIAFQWTGLIEQLAAERAAWDEADGFVADRSVLDFLGYFLQRAPKDALEHPYIGGAYTHVVQAYAARYDVIIPLAPLGIPIEDNGMRNTDDPWRVHELLMQRIKAFELDHKVLTVTADGPEARADQVVALLKAQGVI